MRGLLVALAIVLLLGTSVAWSQTSGSSGATVAERQPAENVQAGAVRERAPGRIVNLARARHTELRDLRLAAQRSGDASALLPQAELAGSTGGAFANLLGGSLSSLLGTFLNSGLAGALGNQTTGSLTPVTNGTGSTGSDFSNLPPEVLEMLAGAGIDLKDLSQKSTDDAAASEDASKTGSRSQTVAPQTAEPSFKVRWADAMLSTFFTALTIGFQTPDFIDVLKDLIRPILIPDDSSADGGDGTPSDGTPSNGGDSGDEPLI